MRHYLTKEVDGKGNVIEMASRCRYCGLSLIHHWWTREAKKARFTHPEADGSPDHQYSWLYLHANLRCPLHPCHGAGCTRLFIKAEEEQDLCAFCTESVRCQPWWKMARWHRAANTYVDEVAQALLSSPMPWRLSSRDQKGDEKQMDPVPFCLYYSEKWSSRVVQGKSGPRTVSHREIFCDRKRCEAQVTAFLSRLQQTCIYCHHTFCVPHGDREKTDGKRLYEKLPSDQKDAIPSFSASPAPGSFSIREELNDALRRTTTPAALGVVPSSLPLSAPVAPLTVCGFCLLPASS